MSYTFSHCSIYFFLFFFFNDTATTEIYTLSLHDALPIFTEGVLMALVAAIFGKPDFQSLSFTLNGTPILYGRVITALVNLTDRKSTRLNSSHSSISYAVFCLKKKTTKTTKQKKQEIIKNT